MSKFDEVLGGEKPGATKPESIDAYGSFACQFCSNFVDEAKYYPTESALVWTCPEGHRSFIEGFDLM